MIFHVRGCVTLQIDAGRVSPGVLLETDRYVSADKLHRSKRGGRTKQQVRPPEHPRFCLRPPAGRYRLQDLSGTADMMRVLGG